MIKKVAFKTLGCRLNQYETEALASQFYNNNYEIVDFENDADAYIVNSCTVTNQSDKKTRNVLSQENIKNNKRMVVVMGCMSPKQKTYFEKNDSVTYLVDNNKKSSVFSLVDAHNKGEILSPGELPGGVFNYELTNRIFHTRSFIKIQDGCDNFCTFCIIPFVRGRAVSRSKEEIIKNVREALKNNYKELVITGVNIGRYERDGMNFTNLIQEILSLPGDFRLRISSLEPDGLGENFADLFTHPKMCPHLHFCLQSGSDKILLQMKRMYTTKKFQKVISEVRKKQPAINLTTDILVGFPGETEEDFIMTCKMAEEIGFSHIHTFRYSTRTGTRAERMPNQVPEKIKSERSRLIREISFRNRLKYMEGMLGKEQTVLIEKINALGTATGYGENYFPVKIDAAKKLNINSFKKVRLIAVEQGEEPGFIGSLN